MKKLLLVVITGICLSTSGFAQGKIGYVSPDEIFALMPEVKKADSSLAAYQQALAENYQQQQDELSEAMAKFVKDSATMTPAVKEVKRQDLQQRISAMQNKEQELNSMLEQEKEKSLKPIREKMLGIIQQVAKDNGYDHVFYREQVIVFPAANDITPLVKKKLGLK